MFDSGNHRLSSFLIMHRFVFCNRIEQTVISSAATDLFRRLFLVANSGSLNHRLLHLLSSPHAGMGYEGIFQYNIHCSARNLKTIDVNQQPPSQKHCLRQLLKTLLPVISLILIPFLYFLLSACTERVFFSDLRKTQKHRAVVIA